MVTVCNLSPVRCGCSAFYDPSVLASDAALAAVLPFVCSPLVAFLPSAWETLDAAGRVTAYSLLEDAARHVDLNATRARMAAFAGAISCDSGNYTAPALVARLLAGRATYHDVYSYAGYALREKLVRGCMATDAAAGSPTLGRRVPCQGDEWWARPRFDPDHGACHTFNPCHGFPVDALCAADADCAHATDPRRPGGRCTAGRCECTRCAAGAGCRVARQGTAGRGQGIRLLGNVGTDQVPAAAAAAAAAAAPPPPCRRRRLTPFPPSNRLSAPRCTRSAAAPPTRHCPLPSSTVLGERSPFSPHAAELPLTQREPLTRTGGAGRENSVGSPLLTPLSPSSPPPRSPPPLL